MRLVKDLKELNSSNTRLQGFVAEPCDDDLLLWEAKIWVDNGLLAEDLRTFASCSSGQDYIKVKLEIS